MTKFIEIQQVLRALADRSPHGITLRGTSPDTRTLARQMLALVEDLIERDRLHAEPFDACEFCLGGKCGTPGNENVYGGVRACDACSVLIDKVLIEPNLENAKLRARTEQFGFVEQSLNDRAVECGAEIKRLRERVVENNDTVAKLALDNKRLKQALTEARCGCDIKAKTWTYFYDGYKRALPDGTSISPTLLERLYEVYEKLWTTRHPTTPTEPVTPPAPDGPRPTDPF